MRRRTGWWTGCVILLAVACTSGSRTAETPAAAPASGGLARVYYWRARPGKLEEYNRYIREVAEPIDYEARRGGAFVSVVTLVSRDSTTPWTHVRMFILRDSTQLAGLSRALDAAGLRIEPDSTKRRVRGEYAATLRDRVGDATLDVLH